MASTCRSKTNHDGDARLKQIQERDASILGHFVHTWKGRVSDDTLFRHVLNIQHFSGWHLNYGRAADELRSVDQITAWDVYDFITDGLPRKSWVDSERRIKSYLATLKKYVEFMAEHRYMPADVATSIFDHSAQPVASASWADLPIRVRTITADDQPSAWRRGVAQFGQSRIGPGIAPGCCIKANSSLAGSRAGDCWELP